MALKQDIESWPFIPHRVRETPLAPEERKETQRIQAETLQEVTDTLDRYSRTHREDYRYFGTLCYSPYDFLINTLLPSAQTVEQVQNLIRGYLHYCSSLIEEKEGGKFMRQICGFEIQDKLSQKLMLTIQTMGSNRWQWLHASNRNGLWMIPFIECSDHNMLAIYAGEPTNDGTFFIISDPEFVANQYAGEEDFSMIPRNTPDSKRMTKEKIARLLQLPGLSVYMGKDLGKNPRAIGTNLAIIAEYACENDDFVRKNSIKPSDITAWLEKKFRTYRPSLSVARYQLIRLQNTKFARSERIVENYILDLHAREHPWLFELAGMTREECISPGSFLTLYNRALQAWRDNQEANDQYTDRLMEILPGENELNILTVNRNYPTGDMAMINCDITELIRRSKTKHIAQTTNIFEIARIIFTEEANILRTWETHEGFELLDPMAIHYYATGNKRAVFEEIARDGLAQILRMSVPELLQLKREVIDQIPSPNKREAALKMLQEIAERMEVELNLAADIDSEELMRLASDPEAARTSKSIIIPEGIRELLGPEHLQKTEFLAEQMLVERHLRGVRGGPELTRYLLEHQHSMRPAQLIMPFPDAPNQRIITEFGDSPDLLSLLQEATLFMYRGYSPDQAFAEVAAQAELAAKHSHPLLTTTGLEWEQVGSLPDGTPVINEERYHRWLDLILPRGGDANERLIGPAKSAAMQILMLSLLQDPKFEFIFWKNLVEAMRNGTAYPSSLHLNLAIPQEISFDMQTVERYLSPLHVARWIAHGEKKKNDPYTYAMTRGKVRSWKCGALLDVFGDKHKAIKAEFRDLAFEADGSHKQDVINLQALGSAAIQLMREEDRLKMSESGRVLASIYRAFTREIAALGENQKAMQGLIAQDAQKVLEELGLAHPVEKKSGIILTNPD